MVGRAALLRGRWVVGSGRNTLFMRSVAQEHDLPFVVSADLLYNTLTYRKAVSIGIRGKRAFFSGETI